MTDPYRLSESKTVIRNLRRENARLRKQIAEYVEQAKEGLPSGDHCPAVFACAFIFADGDKP